MKNVIIILVSLFLIFLVTPIRIAYATTYLSDNFENFSTGWTLTGTNPPLPLKSGEQAHGGSYSMVSNTTTTQYALASRYTGTTITTNWHYRIWLYVPTGITQTGTFICGPHTGSAYIFRTCLMSNATGYFILIGDPTNASWVTSISQIPSVTWTQFEAYYSRTTKKVHVYINGLNQTASYSDPGGTDGNFQFIKNGDPSAASGVTNGKCFLDDLLIDDAAEPTGTNHIVNLSNAVTISLNSLIKSSFNIVVSQGITPSFEVLISSTFGVANNFPVNVSISMPTPNTDFNIILNLEVDTSFTSLVQFLVPYAPLPFITYGSIMFIIVGIVIGILLYDRDEKT